MPVSVLISLLDMQIGEVIFGDAGIGLTEILYAFTSVQANSGSVLAGLNI